MIPAEIGRVVLFWPGPSSNGVCHDFKKPFTGRIAYPWSDRMINVEYADHNGTHHKETSVMLLQDDDPKPDGQSFATWMPYQIGQAAKYEAKGDIASRVADLEITIKGMRTPKALPVAPPVYDRAPTPVSREGDHASDTADGPISET